LTEQKEALSREIAELKAVRDAFLEETTVLNARNEELAQLSTVYTRRLENATELPARMLQDSFRHSSDNTRPHNLVAPSLSSSTSGSSAGYDENSDSRFIKTSRSDELHAPVKAKFKWPGTKAKDLVSPAFNSESNKGKAQFEHNFQQLSVLRFTRCDHCSDKMWGSQLRCTGKYIPLVRMVCK
jgi:Rho-type GTPase-activating protein 1/2